MKAVRLLTVLLTGLIAAIVSGILTGLIINSGSTPMMPNLFLGAFFALLAGVLAYLGKHIRRYRNRESTWMDALAAARTAALARASIFIGALTGGVFVGIAVPSLFHSDAEYLLWVAVYGLIVSVCAWIATVVGIVVERRCIIDIDDDGSVPQAPKRRGDEVAGSAL